MKNDVPAWQRGFARTMRRAPTKAENILWQMVRGRRLGGLKFKRQEPLGPYIADLVCHEHRLIVEADGGQHCDDKQDEERDHYFREQGYRTLRFWNDEIERNSDGVAAEILRRIENA